jgi:hypothetical protein
MVFRSAPHPTIPASPDARSREPGPLARPQRERAGLSRCETLQDRASGVRGGRARCASSRHRRRRRRMTGMTGMTGKGPLKKILMAPCRTSIRPPFPRLLHRSRVPRHRRCVGDTVLRMVNSRCFRRCAACNPIRDEPEISHPEQAPPINLNPCARPKDLLSAREGQASRQKSSLTVLPVRSFGRLQVAL